MIVLNVYGNPIARDKAMENLHVKCPMSEIDRSKRNLLVADIEYQFRSTTQLTCIPWHKEIDKVYFHRHYGLIPKKVEEKINLIIGRRNRKLRL